MQLLDDLLEYLDMCNANPSPVGRMPHSSHPAQFSPIAPVSIEHYESEEPPLILPKDLYRDLDTSILIPHKPADESETSEAMCRYTTLRCTKLQHADWRNKLQMFLPGMIDMGCLFITENGDYMTLRYAMGIRRNAWTKMDSMPGVSDEGFEFAIKKAIQFQHFRETKPHILLRNVEGLGAGILFTDYVGLVAFIQLLHSESGTLRRKPLKDWAEEHWMQTRHGSKEEAMDLWREEFSDTHVPPSECFGYCPLPVMPIIDTVGKGLLEKDRLKKQKGRKFRKQKQEKKK